MKKITDLKENECILCTTLEECNAIMDLMHEAGLKWSSGSSYKELRTTTRLPEQCYYPAAWHYCDKQYAIEKWHTIYPASDFIFSPKRGDIIEVSSNDRYRSKGIFLVEIKWARLPYICVDVFTKKQYKEWTEFETCGWKYARPLQPERKPRTIEATDEEWESIQKQLGINL